MCNLYSLTKGQQAIRDPKPLTETIPGRLGETSARASASAPFVYFDAASTYGFSEGVGNITLEAFRNMSVGGQVVRDRVIVAHLRMSLQAAKDLRAALDGVLLMASPKKPQGQGQ